MGLTEGSDTCGANTLPLCLLRLARVGTRLQAAVIAVRPWGIWHSLAYRERTS
jgi:hypothetical protein